MPFCFFGFVLCNVVCCDLRTVPGWILKSAPVSRWIWAQQYYWIRRWLWTICSRSHLLRFDLWTVWSSGIAGFVYRFSGRSFQRWHRCDETKYQDFPPCQRIWSWKAPAFHSPLDSFPSSPRSEIHTEHRVTHDPPGMISRANRFRVRDENWVELISSSCLSWNFWVIRMKHCDQIHTTSLWIFLPMKIGDRMEDFLWRVFSQRSSRCLRDRMTDSLAL